MEKTSANDDPVVGFIRSLQEEVREKSAEHEEKIRQDPEYQSELSFLRRTIHDFIKTLRLCELAASRWETFRQSYLLPTYLDEIIEAALTAQFAVENGCLNPARRELRYMLEVAVNIAFVDETRSADSFDQRTEFYRKSVKNKANVDHISDLRLEMLRAEETTRASFVAAVRNAWVKASNYVHLTKRRVDEKMRLREQGVALGFETVEMLKQVVADAHEACSIVTVLAFETIGPSFTGDLLVGNLDQLDEWAMHASGYIAQVDSYFDYKHERMKTLAKHRQTRAERIRYPIAS